MQTDTTQTQTTQTQNLEDLQQRVNSLLKEVTTADGHIDWSLAKEQVSPELQVAVLAEKRRRDTQRNYTQTTQKLRQLEKEKEELQSQLKEYIAKTLTTEEQKELEELKYDDPDAYIERMRSLEKQAVQKAEEETQKILQQAHTKTAEEIELERRRQVLEEFNAAHPDTPLTPEQLELEVPVRIVKALENGQISFEQALEEAHKFIYGSKKVANPKGAPEPPALSKTGTATNLPQQDDEEEVIF